MQMTDMDEILNPVRFVNIGLRLSNLILVMWENKVNSTWMDVNFLPQYGSSHCWTFNVPTWSTFPPFWLPSGLVRLGSLPQGKIFFISFLSFLVLFLLLSFSGFDSFEFSVLKLFLILLDVEIDWTVGLVAITIFNDPFDKLNDFRDILGDSCYVIRKLNSKVSIIMRSITPYHRRIMIPIFWRTKSTQFLLLLSFLLFYLPHQLCSCRIGCYIRNAFS